jgi:hypothetical protein
LNISVPESVADKTTGKSNRITITNDKGRLLEEIERMDHMGRVDKELHLNARALHYVPEDEGCVGTAASHRDEHAGEGGWCMREVDCEHGTRTDALQVGS